jgi:hypothetical protein
LSNGIVGLAGCAGPWTQHIRLWQPAFDTGADKHLQFFLTVTTGKVAYSNLLEVAAAFNLAIALPASKCDSILKTLDFRNGCRLLAMMLRCALPVFVFVLQSRV